MTHDGQTRYSDPLHRKMRYTDAAMYHLLSLFLMQADRDRFPHSLSL